MQYLGAISKMTDDLCLFPRQIIQYTVIQAYALTNAKRLNLKGSMKTNKIF